MPWTADQIFAHSWLDVLLPRFEECLRDIDDRPLGEANAPDLAHGATAFDYRACPYQGSRRGGAMNVAALEPMGAAWNDILDLLAWLRAVYLGRYGGEMNYLLLARFAAFCTYFSGWLVRTGYCGWNAVPRDASGLFKAAQGLYFTANDAMIVGGHAAMFRPITVDLFLAHTEAAGLFRIDDKVCAGPPAMVRQFVRGAIDGPNCALPPERYAGAASTLDRALEYADLRLKAQEAEILLTSSVRQEGMSDTQVLAAVCDHRDRCAVLQPRIAALLARVAERCSPEDYIELRTAFGTDPHLAGLLAALGRDRVLAALA